jgi:hypothetical protein
MKIWIPMQLEVIKKLPIPDKETDYEYTYKY